MNETLLSLPWQIQASLASGYAAYLLAYMGIRFGHSSVDAVFVTLVFGLIATGVMWLLRAFDPIYYVPAAFAATIVVAVLWRRFFRDWLYALLYWMKVTWSNDDPSALATIINDIHSPITQAAVELDDGTWLMCNYAYKFKDAPFNPVILGPNGDVALYLTHEERKGEPVRELATVHDENYGDRITYIPAARIRRITLRHLAQG